MILELDTPSRQKADAGADILPADTPGALCRNLSRALSKLKMIDADKYADLPNAEKAGRIVDHGMMITKGLFGNKAYHRHIGFDYGALEETRLGGRHAPETVCVRLTHDVRSVQQQLDLGTEGMSVVMSDRGLYVQQDWKPKNGREIIRSAFDMTRKEMADWDLRNDQMQPLLTSQSFKDIFDILQDPVERAFGSDAAWMRNRI